MGSDLDRAERMILSGRYLTLATSGSDGAWAAPVAYSVHGDACLYYYSAVASRHSSHIVVDPHVAGAIFDSRAKNVDADGVQFEATVEPVADSELDEAMLTYFSLQFPDPDDREQFERPPQFFREGAAQRFYRIRLTHVFVLDLAAYDVPAGTPQIDRRVETDLAALQARLSSARQGTT